MPLGKNLGQAESLIPLIGERDEIRVAMLPQLLDDSRQRIIKILVIAAAKAVTRHDDMTAECTLRGI